MATMAVYCYLTFPTTYDAIRAEKLLQQKSYPFKMVPVPRSISSSCGTALRCACSDSRAIKDYLVSWTWRLKGCMKWKRKAEPAGSFPAKGEETNMETNHNLYFDNAATSWPKPEQVYGAAERYLRQGGNPAVRGIPAPWKRTGWSTGSAKRWPAFQRLDPDGSSLPSMPPMP